MEIQAGLIGPTHSHKLSGVGDDAIDGKESAECLHDVEVGRREVSILDRLSERLQTDVMAVSLAQ